MAKRDSKRKRYCDLKATTLQEILATCERHISNINKTHIDLIQEGDGTSTDDFYIGMFRECWADLRDDVNAMLEKKGDAPVLNACWIVEHTESEAGWGKRPDGYTAHRSQEDARAYITSRTSDYKGPTPECYVQYDLHSRPYPISISFAMKLKSSKSGWAYIDKIAELTA